MAIGFSDPKVKVHIEDGLEFLKRNKETYDVIITDSSDPIGKGWLTLCVTACFFLCRWHTGPAVSLFERVYFERVAAALKPGGIMCMQGTGCLSHTSSQRH